MEDVYFRKIMTTIILIVLVILSFLLLKPILLSIIVGLILAFIFNPVYNWFYKITKFKNLSVVLVCLLLILLIGLPLWFLTPIFIDQLFKFYFSIQQIDFVAPFEGIFPSLFALEGFSEIIKSVLDSSITKIINSIANSLSINNLMGYFLKSLVVFFTFFFVLRDKEQLVSYIKSLLPFSKNIEKKLFESSRDITSSVLYGQIIIGILQGLLVGVGFLIFKVPNALFITLLACLAGIFPVIGTAIIWVPVVIYLLIAANTFSAFGVIIFGLVSSSLDNLIRPIIVSKKTQLSSSLILIGMIGGLFLFGILGFILGPLIIAYLLIILEVYRDKRTSSILIQKDK